ncbi:MAG: protein kinase [Deltaproteobacteria bacterium]|nr:protein kinase [Deltaproteobacteria bacterium]
MAGVPRRLGKYRLERQLAVGGMAEVYLAVAEGLSGFEKQVVVKRLLPQHMREHDLITMFVDEARLLARLHHPNIAEVYDIGQQGDEIFIALEFVDGVDLRDLLRATPRALPVGEAVAVVVAVAEGLAHAHSLGDETGRNLGIVHRDVSPSNVIVARDGRVKLIDFGVAKWTAQRSETRHGTLKGKVHYMSPEQCRSAPLDRRSDVFALGVLLYELTTGQRPFEGESDYDVIGAIVAGRSVAPSTRMPAYDLRLEKLVMHALANDPEMRVADASMFASELRTLASSAGWALSYDALASRVVAVADSAVPGALVDTGLSGATRDVAGGRAAVDRTLTEAAPGPAAPHAMPPDARTRSASLRRRRRSVKLGLGLGFVGLVLATALVAATADRGTRPTPSATPSAVSMAPRETVAPVAHAAAQIEDPTSKHRDRSVPAPKKVKPTPHAALGIPLALPANAVSAAPPVSVPSAQATTKKVWDPDSPIPP